jgi:hypothetical protein
MNAHRGSELVKAEIKRCQEKGLGRRAAQITGAGYRRLMGEAAPRVGDRWMAHWPLPMLSTTAFCVEISEPKQRRRLGLAIPMKSHLGHIKIDAFR